MPMNENHNSQGACPMCGGTGYLENVTAEHMPYDLKEVPSYKYRSMLRCGCIVPCWECQPGHGSKKVRIVSLEPRSKWVTAYDAGMGR